VSQQKPLLGELPDWTRFPKPVALWPFIKAGNLIDLSGNRNTGTFSGNPTWVAGKYGAGIHFTLATSDYISVGDKPTLEGFDKITVVVSGMRDSTNRMTILSKSNSYLVRFLTGNIELLIYDTAWRIVAYAPEPVNLEQYHYVLTWQAGSAGKVYKNGTDTTAGGESANTSAVNANPVLIGTFGTDYYQGDMNFTIIFNRVLSAPQIPYLYHHPWPWFIEDEVSHLYVPAPPTVKPYWYYHQMQSIMRRTG